MSFYFRSMDGHDMSVVYRLRVEVVEMKLPILLFQLRNVALSRYDG